MAKGVRVRKGTHRRNVPRIQLKREISSDFLLQECRNFLDVNSSLSMDDSFDRDRLAEEMVEFIKGLSSL